MNQRFRAFALSVLSAAAIFALAPTARAADSCDPVYNASIKLLQTPHHAYLTMTHSDEQMRNGDTFKRGTGKAIYAGKTETSETIFDGKTSYLLHRGHWMRSPVQPSLQLEDAREKSKTHPAICAMVGNQSIDGQATTLYKVHTKETNRDEQIWISRSSGLPVRARSERPDGSGGEIRYDYSNVRAPAGVH